MNFDNTGFIIYDRLLEKPVVEIVKNLNNLVDFVVFVVIRRFLESGEPYFTLLDVLGALVDLFF